MEEITFNNFTENLYVLSMLDQSSDENIKKIKNIYNINDKNIFYGLNFKNMFYNTTPYENDILTPDLRSYITHKPGAVACLLNHYYAIFDAFKKNASFAFFIEDDVFPIEDFELLKKAIKELPNDFDCLNFGWIPSIVIGEHKVQPIEYSSNLYKGLNMECSGAFGYMLSNKGIQKVISLLSNKFIVSDLMFKFMDSYYMKKPYLGHAPAYEKSRIR